MGLNYKKLASFLMIGTLVGPTILTSQKVFAEESATVSSTTNEQMAPTESSTAPAVTTPSSEAPAPEPTPKPEPAPEPEQPETSEPEQPEQPETSEPEQPTLTVRKILFNGTEIQNKTITDDKGNNLVFNYQDGETGLVKETLVNYTFTPAKGQKLESLTIYDAARNPVQLQDNHFSMPDSDVTVEFTTTPIKEETPKPNPGNGGSSNNNGNTNQNKPSTSNPKPAAPSQSDNQAANSGASRQPAGPSQASSDVRVPSNQKAPTYSNAVQNAIVQEAYKYLGMPYVWGAKGPNAFDCSGLAYVVYANATGHYIGGWTGDQQYAGTQIPVSEAQPGDLLFWGAPTSVTTHVAIYIGNGQYIHAPQPGDVVKIGNISDFAPTFAVRVNMAGLPKADSSLSNAFGDYSTNQPFVFNKNQTTDQFIKKIGEISREIGQKNGIYSSVMIAQAVLESGSGNSSLASEPNYNLFGIKGKFKDQGVTFNTLEQDEAGESYQISSEFRKYPSYKESLEDYANLIKKGITGNADFYKDAWKDQTESYKDATKHLQGRYATDKQYAEKLNAIIKAYDLTQFDQAKETKKVTSGPEIKAMKTTFDLSERLQAKLLASIANNQRIPQVMTTKHFINLFRGDSLIALASTVMPAKKVVTSTIPTAASMYITLSSGLLAILPPLR